MREGRRADAVETGARVCRRRRRRRRRRGRASELLYELSEIALVYVIYWRLLLLLLLLIVGGVVVVRCVVEMVLVMRFGDFVRCFVEEMEMVCCLISAAAISSSVGVGICTSIRVFLHVWLSYLELCYVMYIYNMSVDFPYFMI